MKRFYYIALILCAAIVSSCSRDALDFPKYGSSTEGLLNISFNLTAATRAEALTGDADIRFYKYNADDTKSLIRHYTSIKDMPEALWLLAGKYCVTASVDQNPGVLATFDGGTRYYGEADFEIKAGDQTVVDVPCNILNTMIKVVFDESLNDAFNRMDRYESAGNTIKSEYFTTVVVSDEWKADYANLPYLDYVYDTDKSNEQTGYYVLPDGAERISYAFHGFSMDEKIDNTAIYGSKELPLHEGTREGVMYTMTFKYTPSAPEEGYVSVVINITAQKDWNVKNEVGGINPAAKPGMSGDGVGSSEAFVVSENRLTYTCTYDKPIDKIEIWYDSAVDEKCTIDSFTTTRAVEGITAERSEDGCEVTLTMGADFLNRMTGGEHTLNFTIHSGSVSGKGKSKIVMSGAYELVPTDCWNAKGEMRAYVYDTSASDVKIRYRAVGTETSWTTVDATEESANVYKADAENINANTEYEYQLLLGSSEVGAAKKDTMPDGAQVPNSNFETWSTINNVLCPYLQNGEQWWSSGNKGAAMANKTLTSNVTDKPAGVGGTYSAKLESSEALNVLATGNIYIGEFLGTGSGISNMTKGYVRFGHAFEFTYRPKALQFWYKSEIGTIDIVPRNGAAPGVNKNDQDKQQIYILLCAMTGPHIVYTGDTDTFLDITNGIKTIDYCSTPVDQITTASTNDQKDAHVIGWGVWEPSESVENWTLKDIKINYNSEYEGEVPTWIMITAAANKYGDYYTGCSTNKMWLDEMELVY